MTLFSLCFRAPILKSLEMLAARRVFAKARTTPQNPEICEILKIRRISASSISFPEFGGVFRRLKAPGNSADLLRLKYRGPEAEDK